jgi:hypothetical protein
MIKLCIFGTRSFYDNQEAENILDEQIPLIKPDMIVTAGDADGVCRLAIDKAKEFSIPIELHFLNQKKHAQGKYHYRSLEALQSSNCVLIIHDGVSKGTLNEIELAKKLKLEYKYFKIKSEDVPDISSYDLMEIQELYK